MKAGIPAPQPVQDPAAVLDFYGDSIFRLAFSYVRNREDAQDIVQETLIQLVKKKPSFASAQHQKAWLMQVAANLSRNRIRFNRLRRHHPIEQADHLYFSQTPDLSYVWQAVGTLKPKYREVIHLYYSEGYSIQEIGAILGKSESAVKSCLKRGREQLQDILRKDFDFE